MRHQHAVPRQPLRGPQDCQAGAPDADSRARYWEAVNRGKFIRIALFLHMFGKDDITKIEERSY